MARWVLLPVLLLAANPASADAPARHALHWVRAAGAERCIDPRKLAERVEALTGPAFVAPAQAEISLEGEISPSGRGFRARIVSTDASGVQGGERVLTSTSEDCRKLDAAIAFVIALTVDPALSLSGPAAQFLAEFAQELPPGQALLAELQAQRQAPPSASRDVLAESTPASASAAPALPAAAARRLPRYALGLAAATLGRSLPEWMFGLRASFALDHARLWPLVLSTGAFPSAKPQPITGGETATFQAYDATLSVCPGWRGRVLAAHGCAGLALAYLHARGSSFDQSYTVAMWDPAFVSGGALALGRGWGLGVDALLRVRLTDQRFVHKSADQETQPGHNPPRVGFLFSLGPRYEF